MMALSTVKATTSSIVRSVRRDLTGNRIWMTVSSPGSAKLVGEKGYVIASLNTGYAATPTIFDTYRKSAEAAGHEPRPDRFAYLAIVGIGETEEEGRRRADQILDYSRTTPRAAHHFFFPPGYVPPEVLGREMRSPSTRMVTLRDALRPLCRPAALTNISTPGSLRRHARHGLRSGVL